MCLTEAKSIKYLSTGSGSFSPHRLFHSREHKEGRMSEPNTTSYEDKFLIKRSYEQSAAGVLLS